MIEVWGRGFDKIKEACELYNGPLPEYEITKSGVMVLCKACDKYLELLRDAGRYLVQPDQNVTLIKIVDEKIASLDEYWGDDNMIHLVDIDGSNWRIPLKVSKAQELYVANSTTILARAYAYRDS